MGLENNKWKKLNWASPVGDKNVQSDWDETDVDKDQFIRNKPVISGGGDGGVESGLLMQTIDSQTVPDQAWASLGAIQWVDEGASDYINSGRTVQFDVFLGKSSVGDTSSDQYNACAKIYLSVFLAGVDLTPRISVFGSYFFADKSGAIVTKDTTFEDIAAGVHCVEGAVNRAYVYLRNPIDGIGKYIIGAKYAHQTSQDSFLYKPPVVDTASGASVIVAGLDTVDGWPGIQQYLSDPSSIGTVHQMKTLDSSGLVRGKDSGGNIGFWLLEDGKTESKGNIGAGAVDLSHSTSGEGKGATGIRSYAQGFNTTASGDYSHAEGWGCTATGSGSHVEGWSNTASGQAAHSEGVQNDAAGTRSHAEGGYCTASGTGSHAEGFESTASNTSAHAEGSGTEASGSASHSEGDNTIASGDGAHAEGGGTVAEGDNSHAEGSNTKASGAASHSEGDNVIAQGVGSHAEGGRVLGEVQIVEINGSANTPNVNGSYYRAATEFQTYYDLQTDAYHYRVRWSTDHWDIVEVDQGAETTIFTQNDDQTENDVSGTFLNSSDGEIVTASYLSGGHGDYSHSEGLSTSAIGARSHSEGYKTTAVGVNSHCEGVGSRASGDNSHAEGRECVASGNNSHAEGFGSIAEGRESHAEGAGEAYGIASHAECGGRAYGMYSHAEGSGCEARPNSSHAEGRSNVIPETALSGAHVEGAYATELGSDVISSVGIGTSDSNRKDGRLIYNDGTATLPESNVEKIHSRGDKAIATVEWVRAKPQVSGILIKCGNLISGLSHSLDFMPGDIILDNFESGGVKAYAKLSSKMTKSVLLSDGSEWGAGWSAGDDGDLTNYSGATYITDRKWLSVYAILVDGAIDFFAMDESESFLDIPTEVPAATHYKKIGSIVIVNNDGACEIKKFIQTGNRVTWQTPDLIEFSVVGGGSSVNVDVSVPKIDTTSTVSSVHLLDNIEVFGYLCGSSPNTTYPLKGGVFTYGNSVVTPDQLWMSNNANGAFCGWFHVPVVPPKEIKVGMMHDGVTQDCDAQVRVVGYIQNL